MKVMLRVLAFSSALTLLSTSQAQGLFSDDEARRAILDLRAKITALETENQSLVNRLDGMAKGQLDLFGQLERLRSELAAIRGGVEQNSQASTVNAQQQKELFLSLEKQLSQAKERLAKFEPQPVEVAGQTIMAQPAEKKLFEQARDQMQAKDFKSAASSFYRFNQRFEDSALSPYALNYEGTLHYALKSYPSARRALEALVEKHPTHPITADGMLTLASAQIESERVSQARQTLSQLTKQFPNSPQAKMAADRLKSLTPKKK
jgi:tol-pal system protein YbgF